MAVCSGGKGWYYRVHLLDLHGNVLDLSVVIEAVLRALAAEARLLDTTEGSSSVGDEAGVDTNHTVLELLGDAEGALHVVGEEVGGKTSAAEVGTLDDLLLSLELEERGDGTESLLLAKAHLVSDVSDNGGLKVKSGAVDSVATNENLSTLVAGILDKVLHLLESGLVDDGAEVTVLSVVAELHLAHALRNHLGELVVDTALHVDEVGSDAGLGVGAPLGNHELLKGKVKVGVIEDNERGVAAELEADLLDSLGTLGIQELANASRSSEGQLADTGIAGEDLADLGRLGRGHDVHDTGRHTSLGSDLGDGEGTKGGLGCRLAYHSASSGKCGSNLTREHGVGEVPRGDETADTDGLTVGQDTATGNGVRDGLTVLATALLRKPFEEASTVHDLSASISRGLTALHAEDLGEVVDVLEVELVHAAEDVAALLGKSVAPLGKGLVGSLDGTSHIGSVEVRNLADELTGTRVAKVEGGLARNPLAVHVSLLAELDEALAETRGEVALGGAKVVAAAKDLAGSLHGAVKGGKERAGGLGRERSKVTPRLGFAAGLKAEWWRDSSSSSSLQILPGYQQNHFYFILLNSRIKKESLLFISSCKSN